MKIIYLVIICLFIASHAFAQNESSNQNNELPFFIHESKRIPEFEREDKREGTFVTGLPRLEFDPIRGFGVGGNVFLYFNKTKEDPFFEYTPYRSRLNAELFVFENGRVRYALNFDSPYIFNSKWRLRADAVLWEDPNAQYWGVGRNTLNPLSFRDKTSGLNRTFNRVSDYEENLGIAELGNDGVYRTDFHYNHILQREQLYNLLAERVMMGGKLRFMFGYEALFTQFQSYGGKVAEEAVNLEGEEVEAISNTTLVEKQINDGTWERFNLAGFNNDNTYMFTSMLAAALIYDTRDFEPDPSEGVFLEYSHEYSAPWLGSQFNFNKFMIQGQYIKTLARWRGGKSRLTFAGLGAFGYIWGPKINFIEMWDLSSQAEAGGIMVLGGERSLRGFREARFMAPAVALINLEMRARFFDFKFLKQHIALGLNPFYDLGSVWDRPGDISFHRWQGAPGMGARIAWNQSTILRLDYANSREGGQFFFGFGHIF
ncbi:MAG: peptide-binding protein [Cryomorphaceae bacterium]|nr:MAG: peptide-binding protein [Cryomorphaceae bacterium]